jgi:hypothetical protein
MFMKKVILAALVIGLLGIGILISGCEQPEVVPDVLKIESVSPALDATEVSSTESLSVTFNFSIDTRGITKENVCTDYCKLISGSHTAGTPEVTGVAWANNQRTMTLSVIGWSKLGQGGDNNRVAIRATNRIKDIYGNTLGSEPVLWRYRLRLHDKAAEPTFVLASGSFEADSLLVTIEATDADAIYYTDDGTDPTTSSNLYTAPISLESSKVIKALAVEAGKRNSDVVSAWYDLYWWQALGGGADDTVYALAYDPDNNILYAGGIFTVMGGVTDVHHVAQWDGSDWYEMDGGVEGTGPEVNTLLYAGGNLYVGGGFTTAGTTTVNNIASWNGSAWSDLYGPSAAGTSGPVLDLTYDTANNVLFAGQIGQQAGGTDALYASKWDGSNWGPVYGSDLNDRVTAIAYEPINNYLYVGGWMTSAGVVPVNYMARLYNPSNATSNWLAMGSGITGGSGDISAFATAGTNLYVGGNFTDAGGTTVSNIAVWDGSAWSAVDSGVNNSTYGLAYDASSGNLYVGGNFTTAGGSTANYIAIWDGSSWSTLGSGLNDAVEAIAVDPEGNIYVGGHFTSAGGVSAARIAKWGRK